MGSSPVVERSVLDRARSGDRDAVGELWRTYQPQLLRFLRSRRSASPDDVAAQVWLEVGRSLVRFDGDGRDFQRWCFTIARRRDIDAARRARRRRESPTHELNESSDVAAASAVDEVSSLDAAIELVASLPPQMAEAIMLRVVHDLDVGAVASIMDVSEGNVRVLVHRGLTKLRATMTVHRQASTTTRPVGSSGSGLEVAAAMAQKNSMDL